MKRIAFALALSGVLLLATWVQAPASTTPDVAAPSAADITAIEQAVQATLPVARQIDEEAARLRQRLTTETTAPTPSRDPFRFKAAPPAPSPVRQKTPDAAVPAVAAPSLPPAPPPVLLPALIGITEDATAGVMTRTAVLSMGDDMAMVKIGGTFARFVIQSISATSVEIVDVSSPARTISLLTIR